MRSSQKCAFQKSAEFKICAVLKSAQFKMFVTKIDPNIPVENPELKKLLYGDEKLNPFENRTLLTKTIKYIVNTERFG